MRTLFIASAAGLLALSLAAPADAQQRKQTPGERSECASSPGSAECTELQKSLARPEDRTPGPSQKSTDPALERGPAMDSGKGPASITPGGNPASAGGSPISGQ